MIETKKETKMNKMITAREAYEGSSQNTWTVRTLTKIMEEMPDGPDHCAWDSIKENVTQ
jgi:hypothetical protein